MISSVAWPSSSFTRSLVLKALDSLSIPYSTVKIPPNDIDGAIKLLQWSSYDEINHELVHLHPIQCLSSSYTIRKALIRKHFLSHCIRAYCTKYPTSILVSAYPRTYEFEISFADELDELWADELWELAEKLENPTSWWVLKPGMADRGMGIRLFNNRDGLRCIFEEFEEDPEDKKGGEVETNLSATSVVTSQLRHFVIQEYVDNSLLVDPSEAVATHVEKNVNLKGHKFHLRAYCVAKGALEVYLYDRVLALFSSVPYHPLQDSNEAPASIDLTPHLTNTSLQTYRGEVEVHLLQELVGCHLLSGSHGIDQRLTSEDVDSIVIQMSRVLSETFKAALQMPVHFQPLPNAFELFGVDFLIVHGVDAARPFGVKLLEINAEPAIELTGARLSWILEDLFIQIGKTCVEPFFDQSIVPTEQSSNIGSKGHFIRCLEEHIRGMSRGPFICWNDIILTMC